MEDRNPSELTSQQKDGDNSAISTERSEEYYSRLHQLASSHFSAKQTKKNQAAPSLVKQIIDEGVRLFHKDMLSTAEMSFLQNTFPLIKLHLGKDDWDIMVFLCVNGRIFQLNDNSTQARGDYQSADMIYAANWSKKQLTAEQCLFFISLSYHYIDSLEEGLPSKPQGLIVDLCGEAIKLLKLYRKQTGQSTIAEMPQTAWRKLQGIYLTLYQNAKEASHLPNMISNLRGLLDCSYLLIDKDIDKSKNQLIRFISGTFELVDYCQKSSDQNGNEEVISKTRSSLVKVIEILVNSYDVDEEMKTHYIKNLRSIYAENEEEEYQRICQMIKVAQPKELTSHELKLFNNHYQIAINGMTVDARLARYTFSTNCFYNAVNQFSFDGISVKNRLKAFFSIQYILTNKKEEKPGELLNYRFLLIELANSLLTSDKMNCKWLYTSLLQCNYIQANVTIEKPHKELAFRQCASSLTNVYLQKAILADDDINHLVKLPESLQFCAYIYYELEDYQKAERPALQSSVLSYVLLELMCEPTQKNNPNYKNHFHEMIDAYALSWAVTFNDNAFQQCYFNLIQYIRHDALNIYMKERIANNAKKYAKNLSAVYGGGIIKVGDVGDTFNENQLYIIKILCHPIWLSFKEHPANDIKKLSVAIRCFVKLIKHYLNNNDIKTAIAYYHLSLQLFVKGTGFIPKRNENKQSGLINEISQQYTLIKKEMADKLSGSKQYSTLITVLEKSLVTIARATGRGRKRRKQVNINPLTAIKTHAQRVLKIEHLNEKKNNSNVQQAIDNDIKHMPDGMAHHCLLQAKEVALTKQVNRDPIGHACSQLMLLKPYNSSYRRFVLSYHTDTLIKYCLKQDITVKQFKTMLNSLQAVYNSYQKDKDSSIKNNVALAWLHIIDSYCQLGKLMSKKLIEILSNHVDNIAKADCGMTEVEKLIAKIKQHLNPSSFEIEADETKRNSADDKEASKTSPKKQTNQRKGEPNNKKSDKKKTTKREAKRKPSPQKNKNNNNGPSPQQSLPSGIIKAEKNPGNGKSQTTKINDNVDPDLLPDKTVLEAIELAANASKEKLVRLLIQSTKKEKQDEKKSDAHQTFFVPSPTEATSSDGNNDLSSENVKDPLPIENRENAIQEEIKDDPHTTSLTDETIPEAIENTVTMLEEGPVKPLTQSLTTKKEISGNVEEIQFWPPQHHDGFSEGIRQFVWKRLQYAPNFFLDIFVNAYLQQGNTHNLLFNKSISALFLFIKFTIQSGLVNENKTNDELNQLTHDFLDKFDYTLPQNRDVRYKKFRYLLEKIGVSLTECQCQTSQGMKPVEDIATIYDIQDNILQTQLITYRLLQPIVYGYGQTLTYNQTK